MAWRRRVCQTGGGDRRLLPLLLVAAALSAAAVQSSTAFSPGTPSRAGALQQRLPGAAPTAGGRWQAADPKPHRAAGYFPWRSLSLALLAGACACRGPRSTTRKARSCGVVACKAAAWPQQAPCPVLPPTEVRLEPATPPVLDASQEALLGWTVSACPAAVPAPPSPILLRAAADAAPQEAPSGAPRPANRGRAATLVGGARHQSGRSASRRGRSSRSSHATRRAVGARLLPFIAPPVLKPSFDSSRLRMEIQVGLHSEQMDRSKRPREIKTPSTGSGLHDQCGVFVETYLESCPHPQDP
mmetsp:Transcript_21981/g.68582  ORF Transcript_21981/g.68582 Transcript_21981/m.68582 type:complete len:300 (+) Transcript_21981:92-991(+)